MENKTTDTKSSKTKSVLTIVLKLLLTFAAIAVIFTVSALADLLLRSEDIHMPVICIVGYLLPFSLLPVIWVKKRKKYMKIWLLGAVLCLIVFGADFAAVRHDKSLKVDTARYFNIMENLPDYAPFEEGSMSVNIESETLKLTEDLPVLDGTIAFFPLYSAFMNAVYPETSEFFYGSFDNVQSWGYTELAEKNTDIFLNLEYPTEEEKAYAESCGITYEYTDIGTEALVFFVDKDNPIDSLTVEQLRGIYSGEITNWKELGGENKKIRAYQNESGSSCQNMMERFMGGTALMDAPTEKTYDHLYAWVEQTAQYRNKDNSIGFSFRYCVKDNPDIKILSVDGAAPTTENIRNGSYPVITPIFAVTYRENTNENVDRMLEWFLSEEAQHIIKETGYAGLASDY